MKKITLILFLLACTFVHLACAPLEEPRDYTLKIEKYAAFTTERYIDPLASYTSPDGKALYHIRREGTPENITYTLSVVDLQNGEARDIRAFGDAYSAAGGGCQSGFYYNTAQWDGDTLSFIMVDTNGIGTKFHYNTKTEEWTEERGISYSYASCYTPEQSEAIALLNYGLPEGAILSDAFAIGEKLYQIYIVDTQGYYRDLDMKTKKAKVAEIKSNRRFFGQFLALPNGTGSYNLYRFSESIFGNNTLECVYLDMPKQYLVMPIDSLREFCITNPQMEKSIYIKDGTIHPLSIEVINPFRQGCDFPGAKLDFLCTHGTTLYYLATETVEGVTYCYVLSGSLQNEPIPSS